MQPYYQKNAITIYHGDLLDVLPQLPEASVDCVCTDPPYLLNFMEKEWDKGGSDMPTNELVFRAWFAGLVAGEGCFRIHREKEGAYYACAFSIKMRADEGPLLRALARRTGAGTIQDIPATVGLVNSGPGVAWVVQSRKDCWKIAHLLDGTHLYAKKQREYDLWRKALQVWTETPRGNRWHGPRDNSAMEALWNEMKSLRPFDQELADSHFDPLRQPDYLFHYRWARACLRVVKPGGLMLAFGGPRTFHRLTCAIEDAGWEIRDCLMWLYGQGMPKSLDISKAIDKAAGAERKVVGRYQPPGMEKPWNLHNAKGERTVDVFASSRNNLDITAPATDAAKQWQGWGTALKPSWEPIILAMKALDGTFVANAEKHGVGGLNINASRIATSDNLNGGAYAPNGGRSTLAGDGRSGVAAGIFQSGKTVGHDFQQPSGRWPANLLLDEEAAAQLDAQTGILTSGLMKAGQQRNASRGEGGYHGHMPDEASAVGTYGDSGGASRFFYCSKATKRERGEGNDHPTVKPLALMQYLLTLLSTPTGGLILDPFAGSGTTAMAARELGRPCVCVELDEHNCEIAARRLEAANQEGEATNDNV